MSYLFLMKIEGDKINGIRKNISNFDSCEHSLEKTAVS